MKNKKIKIIIFTTFITVILALAPPNTYAQEIIILTPVSPEESFSSDSPEIRYPCTGGPIIDGIVLDECYEESFFIGGVRKTLMVWYTKQQVEATRIVNDEEVTMRHWLDSDAQAQQYAAWGRQAWEQYYEIFGLNPYEGENIIFIQMEDGTRGHANAPVAGPTIHMGTSRARNGGDPLGVFHEFGHAVQDSYPNCFLRPGIYPANAEYTEGYACVSADAVDPVHDANYFGNFVATYDPSISFFDHAGDNVANKYYLEQVGVSWSSDPLFHHMDAVRSHYEQCEIEGSQYLLDELIIDLTDGRLNEKKLFLNFFAANWAKDWADPITQPELVYYDDDTVSYGQVPLDYNQPLSSDYIGWISKIPDLYAAKYFQIRPQAGCTFVNVVVNNIVLPYPESLMAAEMGINLMAADTVGITNVSRVASISESLTHTFPGAGVNDRIVAIVNGFDRPGYAEVGFKCVTPILTLIEPKPLPNATLVGEPSSPIAFLTRFEVTFDGEPVLGLPESSFSAYAGEEDITFVPGSFQQVGGQYWAVLIPPQQPAGTTFVDMTLCLQGGICDTKDDALLYENRGNSDFALVFDASGSMNYEDIPGEGMRYENAMKAGNVLAGLLQNGDRIMVMDFSAFNNPNGCWLPYGDGDCELDLQTYLERTDVIVPSTIDNTRQAINSTTPRNFTPIGAALVEASNQLQAVPYSTNPKVIVLLSDGQENVNPIYEKVKDELKASGTIINTIGFGVPGTVGENTLAQIASDTNGTFIFVSTTSSSTSFASLEQINTMRQSNLPEELISQVTTIWQPGPLALSSTYDYLATQAQGARRLFSVPQVAVPNRTWKEMDLFIEDGATSLRFTVAGKQGEDNSSIFRFVEILPPGADRPISVSPPGLTLPPNWDVRNAPYDDTIIITNPENGTWKFRSSYNRIDETTTDFVMMASVQSNYILHGRILPPVMDNQAKLGDVVPIVATILDRKEAVKDASVIVHVQKPDGSNHYKILQDDGLHSDGGIDDGIYGALFAPTDIGGVYSVRIVSSWKDPYYPENMLQAEWLGSFYVEPLERDNDNDRMPDEWEIACGLNPEINDAEMDLDRDGLTNHNEFVFGTSPCNADSDFGGENDISEIEFGRDPLDPTDDRVHKLPHISIFSKNQSVRIEWPRPEQFETIQLFISTDPLELGKLVELGQGGSFTIDGLTNNQTHYLTFRGMDASGAVGAFSSQKIITPKADPHPPAGYLLINDGMQVTGTKSVTLTLMALDDPMFGRSVMVDSTMETTNEVSGVVDMIISNHPFFEDAEWEPWTYNKDWLLSDTCIKLCVVYAKFRDAAGNESLVVTDSIQVQPQIFLPLVLR